MKTKANRWVDVTDPLGRELLGRAGDLSARFLLLDLAESIYVGPGDTPANHAVCSLIHADAYLRDRVAYETEPWPKGQMKVCWTDSVDALREGREA